MNVTFRCPRCDQTDRVEFAAVDSEIACPHCDTRLVVPEGATRDGKLWRCLVCPSTELFIRKDFSQSLGVVIVIVGVVVSSIFWAYRLPIWTYAVLFATALIDVVLYFTVGNVLQCYRCQAQYRDVSGMENHGGFDLETHEKHRQQRIRLGQQADAASR
jgi:DNA-directed RNA polymerase subunit RPC12/RpoP